MDFETPIMIPSKGRAGKTKTDKLLRELGLSNCFVVEPQEQHAYASTGSLIMTLPMNGQGITYSRDYILRHMRVQGYKKFWMLDDDINCFGEAVDGKTIVMRKNVLKMAYEQLRMYGPASMYCLELQQFAWASSEVQRDKIAMQCVMFDLEHCDKINYDLRLKIREDYDISFQAIFKGKGVVKSGKYFYGIAAMKSQEGGMSQWYNPEMEMQETWKLCKKWPGLVEPMQKKDRIDVKINWRKIK